MAKRAFPDVPRDTPAGLFKLLSSLREELEIRLGIRGSPGDKFVTEDRLTEMMTGIGIPTTSSPSAPQVALGNAAFKDVGTTAGTVAAGDHGHDSIYDPSGTAAEAVNAHATHGTHPWSAIVGSDDAITTPDLIQQGNNFNIGPRRQMRVYGAIEVKGTLRIESTGKLIVT